MMSIGYAEIDLFREWFGANVKFVLVYRGSVDGFTG